MSLTLASMLAATSLLATAPQTASVRAVDSAFQDPTNPSSSTVTIVAGGEVTFSYPMGNLNHNVAFTGPEPSSCAQTAPAGGGAVPPLPATPQGAGWAGTCRFAAPATYAFVCQQHDFMTGSVVVEPVPPGDPTPPPGDPTPPPGDPTPSPGPGPSGGTPSNRFSLARVRARENGVVRFDATLPGPGRLAARATFTRAGERRTFARLRLDPQAAGTIHVRLRPNRAGRRALRRADRALKVGLRVSYTPAGGERRTITGPGVRIPPA